MLCPKCGNELPDRAKFCSECGEKIIFLEEKQPTGLASRISQARKSAGLDLAQAVQLLGVTESDLAAWELGEMEPPLSKISAMCTAFGVSSDYLLLGEASTGKTESEEEGNPSETYTVVLSTDQAHFAFTSDGIRTFFRDSNYFGGCIFANGKLGSQMSESSLQEMIDLLEDKIFTAPIILCKGMPYEVTRNTVDLFQDRANIFVFYDRDGDTLEQLRTVSPVFQDIMGNSLGVHEGQTSSKDIVATAPQKKGYPELSCPKCGSINCSPIVETFSTGKDFSASKGCCGFVLLGPIGLLCGACGGGKQTKSVTYWVCANCGNKFQK